MKKQNFIETYEKKFTNKDQYGLLMIMDDNGVYMIEREGVFFNLFLLAFKGRIVTYSIVYMI